MNPVSHYVMIGSQQQGPLSFSQLQNMWQTGQVTRETPHFMDGYTEWMPLDIIAEDLDPAPQHKAAAPYPSSRVVVAKSRGVYVILGLFLGGLFGIHNFYIGRFGVGIIQLLITLLTGWLVLPLIPLAVWIILELLLVTKDGKGHALD